jgi:outer membrane protein TolC
MTSRVFRAVASLLIIGFAHAAVAAQETTRAAPASQPVRTQNPFAGSVPNQATPGPSIALSLADALKRGLEQNLGVLLEEQQVRAAEGTRWRLLSGLLPDVSGSIGQTREKVNLAAFGFSGFPGIPNVIGPFDVFDARVALTQPIVDISALHESKEGAAQLEAERHGYDDARRVVVLVVTNLYLQAVAAESRVAAARAQLETAESLYTLAVDQNRAGIVPRLDVLRADVERKAAAQRRIAAQNEAARARSMLGRAIGFPPGQAFTLADAMSYAKVAPLDADAVRARAFELRPDVLRAEARVAAAQSAARAASSERLPSLSVDGNYGWIGSSAATAEKTFAVAATVHVPLFAAGKTEARVRESTAELRQRQAELQDVRAGVSYEIESALRDVTAAAEQVEVAESATAVAAEALTQAQDRFRAGVATNIEVIQAQEASVAAHEAYIAALYAHNIAKAVLARAIGVDEQHFLSFLGGQPPWQNPR